MYIDQAFQLAKWTKGQTGTNPAVGCIIVQSGTIVGIGAHLKEGTAHAEVQALAMAGENADGATLYCTLEPCNHHGRTPPCTEAIINAGIKKVIFAAMDESLEHHGIDKMEQAGIEVVYSKNDQITAFYQSFFTAKNKQRSYITVKLASTLDGKLADDHSESRWLTNNESRQDVHQMRHMMNGVLVGRLTYLKDQPKLDARMYSDRIPAKIILARSGNITLHPQDEETAQRIIIISQRPLDINAEVIVTKDFSASNIASLLYKAGIQHVLVEGGSNVISQFIEEDCFDEIVIYFAPKLLGGTSRNRFYYSDTKLMEDIKQLKLVRTEQFGDDVKLTYQKVENKCLQD